MTISFDDTQAAKLLELLGLPADTKAEDIDGILAVVDDLAKQAADGAKPSEIAAAAKRIGLDTIDADSLEALHRDATEGRQIKAAEAKKKIETTVDDAIGKGKIIAARRKHWVDLISADPGMGEVLASVPNETAVPMSELGHSTEPDGTTEEAEWFR